VSLEFAGFGIRKVLIKLPLDFQHMSEGPATNNDYSFDIENPDNYFENGIDDPENYFEIREEVENYFDDDIRGILDENWE